MPRIALELAAFALVIWVLYQVGKGIVHMIDAARTGRRLSRAQWEVDEFTGEFDSSVRFKLVKEGERPIYLPFVAHADAIDFDDQLIEARVAAQDRADSANRRLTR
jgi:hypothetical protein